MSREHDLATSDHLLIYVMALHTKIEDTSLAVAMHCMNSCPRT